MPQRQLTYVLTGQDKSAGKTLGDVAAHGEKSAARVGAAFSKVGGLIGGEVGEVLAHIGEGFDTVAEKGHSMSAKLTGAGAGIAAVGAVLTGIGSAEKQAQDQLAQAIENTGGSFSDYSEEIEKTIKHQENYGHSAKDTDAALTTLTQATQDPAKAMEHMGLVADLAASKHISLADASQLVAKILAGSGTRTLKAYGITTTNTDEAIDQLSKRLHGQASAAVDNWSGRLKVAETKVSDFVATVGERFGPTLTAAGSILTAAGAASELWGKHVAKAAEAAAAAEEESAAGSKVAALDHAESAATTAEAASASSSTVVQAEAAASAAEDAGAAGSADASATHVAASAATANAAIAASAAIVSAEAAEGTSVVETSAEEVASLATVGAAAEESAAVVVAASEAKIAANEAAAASSVEAGVASSASFGPMGLAVAGIAVVGGLAAKALGLFGGSTQAAIRPTQDFTNAILADNDALGENTRKLVVNKLEKDGAFDQAAKLGISESDLTDAVMGNANALTQVNAKLKDAKDGHTSLAVTSVELSGKITDSTKTLEVNETAAEHVTAANKELAASQKAAADMSAAVNAASTTTDQTYKTSLTTVASLRKSIEDKTHQDYLNTIQMQLESDAAGLLSAAFDKLNGTTMDVEQSNIAFKNAEAAADDAIKQNGKSLSDNSAKGRQNVSMVLDAIQAAQQHADAVGKQTGSTEKASATFLSDVAALKAHLIALGYDKDAVDALVKKYGALPAVKKTQVDIVGDAKAVLDGIISRVGALRGAQVAVHVSEQQDMASQHSGGSDYFAGGLTSLNERSGDYEAVDLPRGTKITPNSKMKFAQAPTPVQVTVQVLAPVGADYAAAGRDVARALEAAVAHGTRLNIGRGIVGR